VRVARALSIRANAAFCCERDTGNGHGLLLATAAVTVTVSCHDNRGVAVKRLALSLGNAQYP
jgi:hypothetical protein